MDIRGMLWNPRLSRFSILLIYYFSFWREAREDGPQQLSSLMIFSPTFSDFVGDFFCFNQMSIGAGCSWPIPQRTNKGLLLYHIIRFGEQGLVGVLAPSLKMNGE